MIIEGVAYSCAACIRGHRARRCTHNNGVELFQLRPKGRPSSQCDACKAARKAGGSHTKCECGNKNKKGNIEMLLNPCQCQFGGPCLCCRPGKGSKAAQDGACCSSKANGVPCSVQEECPQQPSCCEAGPSTAAPTASSCCGGGDGKSKDKAPTLPPPEPKPAIAPDASLLALLSSTRASAPPPDLPIGNCSCGEECNCNGCSDHPSLSPRVARQGSPDDCPTKCETCIGCAVGLTAPECGIEAVDAWMRTEKAPSAPLSSTSRKRRAVEPLEVLQPPPPAPFDRPLAPMLGAPMDSAALAAFHAEHFQDSEKRAYFAAHLADSLAIGQGPSSASSLPSLQLQPRRLSEDQQYTTMLPGETEEQWQARFGLNYLTPSDVNYFDTQARLREDRKRAEAKAQTGEMLAAEGLAELRAKAMAGRTERSMR